MQKSKRKELAKNIFLLSVVLLLCFISSEIIIQKVIGHYDPDGQFYIRHITVKPYVLPDKLILSQLQEFEDTEKSYIIPDPILGWTINNNSKSKKGLYESNSIGIRSPDEFQLEKKRCYTDCFVWRFLCTWG